MDDRIIADLLMDYVEISLSEDLTSSLNNNTSLVVVVVEEENSNIKDNMV